MFVAGFVRFAREGHWRRSVIPSHRILPVVLTVLIPLLSPFTAAAQSLLGDPFRIENSFDNAGHTWNDSTLVITSQVASATGFALQGYFDWLGSRGQYGREIVVGTLSPTGDLRLTGLRIDSSRPSSGIVTSTYAASVVDNGLRIVNGAWSGSFVVPGTWEARRSTTSSAPIPPGELVAPTLTGSVAGPVVELGWTDVPAGTSYWVEAGSSPGQSNLYSGDVGRRPTVSAVVATGTYYVRVRTRSARGLSAPSNEVVLSVGTCAPPPAPTGLTTTIAAGRRATVAWQRSTGATSTVLEVGSTPAARDVFVGDVGAGTSLATIAPVGIYYVRARAVSACGAGAASADVRVEVR